MSRLMIRMSLLAVICIFSITPACFANDALIPVLTEIASPAVVNIEAGDNLGSGFFINSAGFILTNKHVVKETARVIVTLNNGRSFPGEVVFHDEKDYAIIKTNLVNTPSLRLGTSKTAKQGEAVLVIGSPKGLAGTVSKGIISFLARDVNGSEMMQLGIDLNPGNSGGPVLNMSGEVIGIATATISDAKAIGFAVPIEATFQALLDKDIPINTSLANTELALRQAPDSKKPFIPQPLNDMNWYYFAAAAGAFIFVVLICAFFLWRGRACRKAQDIGISIHPPKNSQKPNDDDIDINLW